MTSQAHAASSTPARLWSTATASTAPRRAGATRRWRRSSARGKIAGLELQPRFDCVVAGVKICSYVADFRYRRDGAAVVEDVKGVRTAVYRLKRKLAEACHPGLVITEIPAAGAGRPRRR